MRYIEKTILIERIDQLIRLKATGSARELAKRVGVSKSSLYEILEVMKMMGAEISYCRYEKSYYYTAEKVLAIGFVEPMKIKGGKKSPNILNAQFFRDKFNFTLYQNQNIEL